MDENSPYGTFAPRGVVRWVIERTRRTGEGWWARRLMFVLRRIAMRALRGGAVDIETFGARMRLRPYNNISEKKVLFTPHLFDPRELAILAGRIGEGFTFVDIGANIGAYSLFVAARAGPTGRILAIEPQPSVFDRLARNIGLNPFGTVKAVACAVADKTGDVTLFLDARNSGESSVKIVGSGQSEAIRVPAATLHDLLVSEGIASVDAIKLDVEGAEDIILEPFFRTAPESLYPALIVVENGTRRWQIDLPALLEERGYRLVETTRMNFVYERPAEDMP